MSAHAKMFQAYGILSGRKLYCIIPDSLLTRQISIAVIENSEIKPLLWPTKAIQRLLFRAV